MPNKKDIETCLHIIELLIFKCFVLRLLGLSATNVFQAGHGLGGIVLQSWAKDNPDLSRGIILLGSYLPDGFFGNGDTNIFPVPVLTAVGSLDGGSLSYAAREARESRNPAFQGKFPVIVVDRVNHAQIASGEIPDLVISNDIDAEIDNDEAFNRYAKLINAFMVIIAAGNFPPAVIDESRVEFQIYQNFTDSFLEPFDQMKEFEQSSVQNVSKWVIEGQKIISGTLDYDGITITNEVVIFSDLGDFKPSCNFDGACKAKVTTCVFNDYPTDPLDFGGLVSADTMKAKFKLEDVVEAAVCSSSITRRQCKDVNIGAYELALQAASDEARTRFLSHGRQLTFADDYFTFWGPGWEYSGGLDYKTVRIWIYFNDIIDILNGF